MDTPSFKEDHISQIPALQMLVNLGYTYLSPAEADRQRGGKTTNVLLEDILRKQLKEINSIRVSATKISNFSCTPKGKIILNPELIKAPKGCIEYVIIHELCHLIHHDHTQKFIDLQSKEMKDWEKWKMKLEKLLA